MSRRLLILALVLLVVLASCGGSTAPTPTPTLSPASQVEITFWHAWHDQDGRLLSELVREYNSLHPEVYIQVQEQPVFSLAQSYSEAVANQTAPDLVLLPDNKWIGAPDLQNRMLPLGDVISGELDRQLALLLNGSRLDGQLYGIPISYNLPVLFFHQGHMTEGPPPNTREMLSRAEFVGRAGVGFGLAYNMTLDFTLPYLSAFGGRVFNSEGKVVLGTDGARGAEAWLEWLRQLSALSKDGKILAKKDKDALEQAVQSGSAQVMVIDWAAARPKYQNIWGQDLVGIAALPPLAGTEQESPTPARVSIHSEVLVLNPTSEAPQKQAALAFAEWLAGPDAQRRLLELPSKQPANSAVDLSAHPLNARLREIAEATGQPEPPLYAFELVRDKLEVMVQRALDESEPVNQEVDRTAAQICLVLGQQC